MNLSITALELLRLTDGRLIAVQQHLEKIITDVPLLPGRQDLRTGLQHFRTAILYVPIVGLAFFVLALVSPSFSQVVLDEMLTYRGVQVLVVLWEAWFEARG